MKLDTDSNFLAQTQSGLAEYLVMQFVNDCRKDPAYRYHSDARFGHSYNFSDDPKWQNIEQMAFVTLSRRVVRLSHHNCADGAIKLVLEMFDPYHLDPELVMDHYQIYLRTAPVEPANIRAMSEQLVKASTEWMLHRKVCQLFTYPEGFSPF